MNVIVSNEQKEKLESLECDIIKEMTGQYSSKELVEIFKDFFYNKIIIDVTALKDYESYQTYEELAKELNPTKMIFFLPEKSKLCTSAFLSHLISMGIYNFTPNIKGINFLINKSNTLEDVKRILNSNKKTEKVEQKESQPISNNTQMTVKEQDPAIIIGFKNVTEHAGTTTLIYMLKKELNTIYGKDNVACIEVGKEDFQEFGEPNMYSVFEDRLESEIKNNQNKKIILIDMNRCRDKSICNKMFYLVEPSTIKLNKLMKLNNMTFQELKEEKIILNISMLNNKDVAEFEKEAHAPIYYNIPPLDERKRNQIINEFLVRIGLLGTINSDNNSKIFGLFRR